MIKIVVDANLSRRYVEELGKNIPYADFSIDYVNDIDGSMPDQKIMEIASEKGAFLVTCNGRDFRQYEKLISLKSRKTPKRMVDDTINKISEYEKSIKKKQKRNYET